MARADDERFMRLALAEARKGMGFTHPNPAVGAVIVKRGRVIATGFHARAGTAHAEANALMLAGTRAKGATIYSTLEPCDHFGRTPPCTQAILDHGLARVVYGSSDPNPLVDGKGIKRLKRAGLAVSGGVLASECDALNEPFFKVMRTGLPFITLKAAITLDGKIATRRGASKWITGNEARQVAHQMRHAADAVIVGAGTVATDDPRLTTRIVGGRDAMRVVIDPTLRTKPSANVYGPSSGGVVVITDQHVSATRARAFVRRGVRVLPVRRTRDGLELQAALRTLAAEGVLHVLVEGGAGTTAHFLRQRLVDELCVFIAPTVFGHEGLTWAGPLVVDLPAKAPRFSFRSVEQVGGDLLVRARPVP